MNKVPDEMVPSMSGPGAGRCKQALGPQRERPTTLTGRPPVTALSCRRNGKTIESRQNRQTLYRNR